MIYRETNDKQYVIKRGNGKMTFLISDNTPGNSFMGLNIGCNADIIKVFQWLNAKMIHQIKSYPKSTRCLDVFE